MMMASVRKFDGRRKSDLTDSVGFLNFGKKSAKFSRNAPETMEEQ
jgi:hypothetical protein